MGRSSGGVWTSPSAPGAGRRPDSASIITAPTEYEIGLDRGRVACSTFRRQIARRTEHDARHREIDCRIGHRSDVEALGDAEVGDPGVPVVQEDVAGFDVAVEDAAPVGGSERAEDLCQERDEALRSDRSTRDLVAQRPSRQALHHQIRGRPVLPVVKDRHDVRMDQTRRNPRLLLEPHAHAGEGLGLRAQDLDGDRTLEPLVEGVEDPGHPAFPEHPVEAVTASEQPDDGSRFHPGCLPGSVVA